MLIKKTILLLLLICSFYFLLAQSPVEPIEKRVTSTIDSSYSNELVLIQEFHVKVPVDSVWNTYTTKAGWEAAFVPLAEVDFKINGRIRTSYNKEATIGDSSTIVLHILNYVPQKLITLQAELSRHFPTFMKADEKDLYNIIYFEKIEASLTKVTSYGIGYKNNPKYQSLMHFFIRGNEMSFNNLISYLETGQPIKH